MSDLYITRYKTPPELDTSLEAIQARLIMLQPSLGHLMAASLDLFEGVYPQAPHPLEDSTVAYATHTANTCPEEGIPMGRELTVVLGAGKWVRIFRNTNSCPDAFPRQRLWVYRPEQDLSMRINVFRTHDPRRTTYPYDVEIADYDDTDRHVGFVGGGEYYGYEPFVEEAMEAVASAKELAVTHGFFIAPLE